MEGYKTDTAKNGQEAIEKSKNNFFDLALLDIKLPDMEGTQLVKLLQDTLPKTKKIMVTGFPALDNAIEALNLGADAYLMKPVNPEKLLEVCKEKLDEQEQAEKMNQEKVKKWIEKRVQKLKQT
jgi:YesN/AraC family two-component response regulator